MRYDDFREVMSRSEPSPQGGDATVFRRASDDDGAIYKGGYVAPHATTASEGSSDTIAGDTTTNVDLLSSESAHINSANDQDWFRVLLVSGQTYDFTMNASSSTSDLAFDSHLTLHNGSGTTIASGIEGAFGDDSVLTFTATSTGIYYLAAQSLTGSTGAYTVAVSTGYVPTHDGSDNGIATTSRVDIGQTVTGTLDMPGDRDWYAVTLTAGQGYDFALTSNGDGTLHDTILYVYDQYGNQIAQDDDGGLNHNSDLKFAVPTTGTYYIAAAAFNDGQHGSYTLSVNSAPAPLLTDSIDWGTKLSLTNNTVHVYFAGAGEVYDGETSLGWNAYEIQQAMAALKVYSNYLPLTFVQVTDPSQAEFKLVTANDLGDGVLAYMNPPGTDSAGVGVFSRGSGWSSTGSAGATAGGPLEPGGLGFDTLIHEFGHGLGLAHPFDNGGGSPLMLGITDTYSDTGLAVHNQGVYTIMSYNDGWPEGPVPGIKNYNHGFDATPMAIDIAKLQEKYGTNAAYHSGNDTYYLDGSSTQTSYMSIWDTGGTDTISAEHLSLAQYSLIDLRSATMDYFSDTSGGAVSYVYTSNGGLTIDQGVQIENATGHTGSDTIFGNDLANVIVGNGGGDSIHAAGGDDTITISHLPGAQVFGDTVDGGDGFDTLYLDVAYSAVTSGNWASGGAELRGANFDMLIVNVEKVVFTDVTMDSKKLFNAAPELTGTLRAVVPGGGQHILTSDELGYTDGNDDTAVFYVQAADKLGTSDFSGATTNGIVTVDGVQANTFTAAQLANGEVAFVHDGTLDVGGSFTISAYDGKLYASAQTFELGATFDHGDYLLVVGTPGADVLSTDGLDFPTGQYVLQGGAGSDTYYVDGPGTTILESPDNSTDTVFASVDYTLDDNLDVLTLTGIANLTATGNALANTLNGNDGNNVLDGGGGQDVMHGGAGDDTYLVDNYLDQVVEYNGQTDTGGDDTVIASVGYNLPQFIENITLTGAANYAYGNTLDNVIHGGDNDDLLYGWGGDDKLYGGDGNDTLDGGYGAKLYLEGGYGNDTYQVYSSFSDREINNYHAGDVASAVDTVNITANVSAASVSVSRTATGDLVIDLAPYGKVTIDNYFNGADYQVQKIAFADGTIWTPAIIASLLLGASDGPDIIDGNDDANTIDARGGDDIVHGMGGNDILTGGAGDDLLDGGSGADRMEGDAGNDVYVVDDIGDRVFETPGNGADPGGYDTVQSSVSWHLGAYIENLTLTGTDNINATGNELVNILRGNAGNNVLNGGLGADSMIGGLGDDAYFVDNTGDNVSEQAGEGYDRVVSSIDYVLTPNVEQLTLTGTAIKGSGGLDNNTIIGNANNNILDGGYGDDLLNGGTGADRMLGNAGNDTYMVDDAGDRAVETHNGSTDDGGVDLVQSYVSFHLGAFIENLTLIGGAMVNATGNELDNVLTGNSNDNVINGGLGADTMSGGKGNDTYFVDNAGDVVVENAGEGTKDKVVSSIAYTLTDNVENLTVTGTGDFTVTGNGLGNILVGNAGNNLVDGSGGGDHMFGGAGNDTYIVDNDNDRVSEQLDGTHDDGGTDTVMASVTYHIFSFVENLTLTGTADINGTGNQFDNVLVGNSGNNVLNGQIGADTMSGGLGNDGYIVDNSGDIVLENTDEGVDKVSASISYALTDNVENLALTGTTNLNATGNGLDNVITGNSGNNWIDGGVGADRMFGGAGDDTYVVDNALDRVSEALSGHDDGGTDTVMAGINFTLGAFLENLTLTGSDSINAIGNSLANMLTGNIGSNALTGGAGADTFVFGLASGADTITDFSLSDNDTIDVSAYHAQATAIVAQSGNDATIDLGGGNVITVLNATATDPNFLSHIVW